MSSSNQEKIAFELFLQQMNDSVSSLGSENSFEDDASSDDEDFVPQRRQTQVALQIPRTPLQPQRALRRPNTCNSATMALDRQRRYGGLMFNNKPKAAPQLETRGDVAARSVRHLLLTEQQNSMKRISSGAMDRSSGHSRRSRAALDKSSGHSKTGGAQLDMSGHSRRKLLPRQVERLQSMDLDAGADLDGSMRWAASSTRGGLVAEEDPAGPKVPRRQSSKDEELQKFDAPPRSPSRRAITRQAPRRLRTFDGNSRFAIDSGSGHGKISTTTIPKFSVGPIGKRLPPRKTSNSTVETETMSSLCGTSVATDTVALRLPAIPKLKKPDILRKPMRQVSNGQAPPPTTGNWPVFVPAA